MASETEKSLLEKELEHLEKEGRLHDILLSDLVMMQMVGDFDKFVDTVSDCGMGDGEKPFAPADKMIEDTEKQVTTSKLFPSIVEKTIQSQFGDKHAALRELGQNGMDSYECYEKSKPVLFDISKDGEYLVLKVRDYGCGMDLKSLVKELLVPYNSGKEFDLTKIGEHGIGWYSIVDLAELVKVVTKPRDSEKAVQAIVYKKKDSWRTAILPSSENGFSEDLDKKPYGTEVYAYIPENVTSEENLRDFLFQYLGMVDKDCAQIVLGKELVNSARDEYQLTVPVQVSIGGKEIPLMMGASKRKLKDVTTDNRFKHRDLNLEKIIYTQNGLFIKYDFIPFDSETVHNKLMNDLAFMGLDFWVEVPDHVTLTKGRNNIIADHGPAVLEGMYQAFESLFLEVLLNDEELLYHPSQVLLESISKLFAKNYADTAMFFERNKYSFKRRVVSIGAAIGSKTIDLGSLVAGAVGKYASKCTKYAVNSMPSDMKSAVCYVREQLPHWGRFALRGGAKLGAALTAGGGLFYGGVKLYEAYGVGPFLYTLAAGLTCGSAYGTYKVIKHWPGIKEWFSSDSEGNLDIGPVFSTVGGWLKDKYTYLLNKCGLYVDLEEKRKRKMEKQRRKISEKYLSKMQTDEFFKKVMDKKIIPAKFYHSENSNEEEKKKSHTSTFSDLFKFLLNKEGFYDYQEKNIVPKWVSPTLQNKAVQLSIDDLIDLYLKGKLRYAKSLSEEFIFRDGDYLVDYNHPVVHTVISRLEQIAYTIKSKYDVKVLEDHLDNLWTFTKEACAGLYLMSPIGITHLMASAMFKSVKNPFNDFKFYKWSDEKIKSITKWYKNYEQWLPAVGRGAKGCAKFPFLLTYLVSKGIYNGVLVPSGKALNPIKYPTYVKKIAGWGKRKVKERKEKARVREELEKTMSKKEAEFSKPTLFERIKDQVSDWYQNSIVNELFGYGVIKGEYFYNLKKKRLEYITKVVGAGQVYNDFMNTVEELDRVVCKALDEKPFKILLSYSPYKNVYKNDSGFILNKDGTLMLNIFMTNAYTLLQDYEPKFRDEKETSRKETLTKLGYTVLDLLVHQRTHQALKKYEHEMDDYDYGYHTRNFFDKKTELRRKVVDYLEQQKIDIVSYVGKFFPEESKNKDFYYITVGMLSKLVHMTRRRLRDEMMMVYEKKAVQT